MSLRFSVEGDLVLMVCEDDFDVDDLRTTFGEIADAHGSKEVLRILVDDMASNFRPDASALRQIAMLWADAYREMPVRIALLVAREVHFGMGRILGAFTEDFPIEFDVFRDRATALAWLQREPPTD